MASPITVAIPTCNGARHLRAALESAGRSTIAHDLLIVDDRSDDATLVVAREVSGDRARIVVNPERLGLAGNWNRCVALSESPVVAIFHQDDVMLSGHLATHEAAHRRDPALGWVASHANVIDDRGRSVAESVVERGGLGDHDRDFTRGFAGGGGIPELASTNPLRCSAVTINRAAHAEVGGFDPSYRYVVDWDFWLRVAAVRPVAWRAATTVTVRWHPASETHRFAEGTADLDETARLIRRIDGLLDRGFVTVQDWPGLAHRRLGRAYLNRAYLASRSGNPALVRLALRRAFALAPGLTLHRLAFDPRLTARLVAANLIPGWARRPNGRRPTTGVAGSARIGS